MSQSLRQSELFAGNDWFAVYRAFTEVNLNASDFSSIRQSMVEYIRRNYPEDFNDWIESSEFVAIIDLLAFLGQSLAFRTDINARENFMDVARRRESILRLARSLSYNAKRNYPARGLAKLTELRTTFDVYDSTGRNLNNLAIRWDDPNNPDWFEQWILVLNSSLIETNPFGVALKSENLDGVETQLYRLDSVPNGPGTFPFTASVNSQRYGFDVVNPDFNTTFGFVEQNPDPNSSFHIIYKSDGNGNSSPNTGFFVYFKQGVLQKSDFSITEPQENRSIFINTQNINETDVWVQSVDDLGSILVDGNWLRVGHVPSDDVVKVLLTAENITYNDIDPEVQNIYQVVTQEQDKITLRFGDGRFGRSPTGNLRVWYRVSANEPLNIRPEDIQGIQINVPFFARNNTNRVLSMTFSLQEAINNSVASETNGDIRRRASRVYSTQGRMVSGSDYNELPVQTNLAVKLRAVNRVYSGQSRYIDLNDPTGNYQNTKVFADDGAFYLMTENQRLEISQATAGVDEMMTRYIQEMVDSVALRDFYSNWIDEQTPVPENLFTNFYLEKSQVRRDVRDNLELNRTFGLGFDNTPGQGWYVLSSSEINPDLDEPYSDTGPNRWLIYCEFGNGFWRIISRGLFYVFESERDCKFFFVSDSRNIDSQTGRSGSDTITLLRRPNGLPVNNDISLRLESPFLYSDGFQEPSRVKVRFNDLDADGEIDFPSTYQILKDLDPSRNAIVHWLTQSIDGYPVERLVQRLENTDLLLPGQFGFKERVGSSPSRRAVDIFIGNPQGTVPTRIIASAEMIPGSIVEFDDNQPDVTARFTVREGINNLIFQWRHFAPSSHRIDPSVSNIIDIFVLTREYNDSMISWRNGGADPATQPRAPSELNLRTTFNQLENFKMFSDEIVWRPVKFKLLFGESADPTLRAKFKVIRLASSSISDGEIRSRVIDATRLFFDVNNWQFGETFYFSELAAYIHRQLSTSISSIEIVPVLERSQFGDLREIRCASDELFFTTAQVSDVDIITANTPANLRIKK